MHPSVPIAADFYMSLYNVVFSALVPLIVGTMDVDVSKEMSRKYPGRLGLFRDAEFIPLHLAQRQTFRPCCPMCQHYWKICMVQSHAGVLSGHFAALRLCVGLVFWDPVCLRGLHP